MAAAELSREEPNSQAMCDLSRACTFTIFTLARRETVLSVPRVTARYNRIMIQIVDYGMGNLRSVQRRLSAFPFRQKSAPVLKT